MPQLPTSSCVDRSLPTSRKRHVKCDEAKPSCSRCIKWNGGVCEGYDPQASKPDARSPPSSEELSPSSGGGRPPVALAPDRRQNSLTLLKPAGDTNVFSSEWEKIYFDRWLTLAHNLGGGWFEAKLFTQTIPQVAQAEPAVRHACMAIGALAHGRARTTCAASEKDNTHYKSALGHYGRAIHLVLLQKGLNDDSEIRAVVFSCLLFIAFEFLHGNREAALRHTTYGLRLVEQQFLRRKKDSPESMSAGRWRLPSTASYDEVEDGDKSPAHLVLGGELLQIFQRLDHQAWSTAILNPARQPTPMWHRASANRPWGRMPKEFDDLEEARRWWDLVQHRVLRLSRALADRLAMRIAIRPPLPDEFDISDVDGVKEMQTEHLAILERWNAAFRPLYTSARASRKTDAGAYYRAVSLQLQYQTSRMCARAVSFCRYDTISTLTPAFREVVGLSAALLTRQHREGGETEVFTLDNGPTMALFIVAVKCRDAEVREDAVRLLQKYPRRDALWDSRALAAVAEVNRWLEVMNESDGDVREQWMRLRRRELIFDERPQECTAWYYVKDEAGEWKLAKHDIRW